LYRLTGEALETSWLPGEAMRASFAKEAAIVLKDVYPLPKFMSRAEGVGEKGQKN
jgi:hypothetical protein